MGYAADEATANATLTSPLTISPCRQSPDFWFPNLNAVPVRNSQAPMTISTLLRLGELIVSPRNTCRSRTFLNMSVLDRYLRNPVFQWISRPVSSTLDAKELAMQANRLCGLASSSSILPWKPLRNSTRRSDSNSGNDK